MRPLPYIHLLFSFDTVKTVSTSWFTEVRMAVFRSYLAIRAILWVFDAPIGMHQGYQMETPCWLQICEVMRKDDSSLHLAFKLQYYSPNFESGGRVFGRETREHDTPLMPFHCNRANTTDIPVHSPLQAGVGDRLRGRDRYAGRGFHALRCILSRDKPYIWSTYEMSARVLLSPRTSIGPPTATLQKSTSMQVVRVRLLVDFRMFCKHTSRKNGSNSGNVVPTTGN